jgi:hypothetical protein
MMNIAQFADLHTTQTARAAFKLKQEKRIHLTRSDSTRFWGLDWKNALPEDKQRTHLHARNIKMVNMIDSARFWPEVGQC